MTSARRRGLRAGLGAALLLAGCLSAPVRASTFWVHLDGLRVVSQVGVRDPHRLVDAHAGTPARFVASPGHPASLVLGFSGWQILKGVSLNIGALPAGTRCSVGYLGDGDRLHPVWYLDGPHPAGPLGFAFDSGFHGWPAALSLRIRFERLKGSGAAKWALYSLDVYAEE